MVSTKYRYRCSKTLVMKNILYIFLFLSLVLNAQFKVGNNVVLENGYTYKVVEKIPKYFKLEKKYTIKPKRFSLGSIIEFEVRINSLGTNGMYLVSLNNTLRKAFGFSNYEESVTYGNRRYKGFDIYVTNSKGYQFKSSEVPLKEWVKITAILNEDISVKSLELGAWLYDGDAYDLRYFKVNGKDYTPKNVEWFKDKIGDGGTVRMIGDYLLEIQLKDNTVTPRVWDYYPEKNLHRDSWQDASYSLNKCFNSTYYCYVPAGLYPYWKPLNLNVAKMIEFEGNSILPKDLRTQKHQTILAQMGNFHGITFRAEAQLKNGLFYCGFVDGFDKSVIRYDTNYILEHSDLIDVTIQGRRETLYETGKGGTAIYVDFKNATRFKSALSVTNMTGRIRHMAKGVHVDMLDYRTEKNRYWAAGITTDFYMRGVKQPLVINGGNVDYHKLFIQDQAVLNEEEKDLKAVILNLDNSFADVFLVDGGKHDAKLNKWSHNRDYIAPVPKTMKFLNRSFIYNTTETLKQVKQ